MLPVLVLLSAGHAAAEGHAPEASPIARNLCPPTTVRSPATESSTPLVVRRWVCLLQADALKALPDKGYDTVVMDYSRDGTERTRYTAAEISRLRTRGYRNILAYLSIGEAESYRYYFDARWVDRAGEPSSNAPCWLGRLNPNWPGNYKVQYWSEEWQQIVLGYLGRIVSEGFDGIYLDIVDAFEYWSTPGSGESTIVDKRKAAEYMMQFIERLAAYARARNPDFHIVIQNAESILAFDTDGRFLSTIDGIGVEDLYYNERVPENSQWIDSRIRFLNIIRNAGKPVMVIDYVYAGSMSDRLVRDFIGRTEADGYIPYPAWKDRRLDRVTPTR
jgi:cysteinyl-tRNA synthetase